MRMTIEGGRYAFRCVAAVPYGVVAGKPDGILQLDLLIPDPLPQRPPPIVLYLYGGGWVQGVRSDALYPWFNPMLAAQGFITAAATYRYSTEAAFPAQIHDVKAAVRWLRANAPKLGGDAEHIGVWGPSAGGHLSALVGTSADVAALEGEGGTPGVSSAVQAVVALCPPTDFGRFVVPPDDERYGLFTSLLGARPESAADLAAAASPITYVRAGLPPFLVIHGTADEVVPFEQAAVLVEALRDAGNEATLLPVRDGLHSMRRAEDPPMVEEPLVGVGEEIIGFFRRTLVDR